MVIDTHCHIYLSEFDDDRDEIILRAEKEGVTEFLLPAIDSLTHEQMIELERKHHGKCRAMIGLHPCSVKENFRSELEIVSKYLIERKFVAIGEIGLDLYWDKTFIKEQIEAFHTQIEWAIQYGIPIVIHSRDAVDECIKVVSEHKQKKLKGVFHCFSGTIDQANKIKELGFYLGIGGVVTFKNSGLDKVMEQIGLENVVLETDSPYLAPAPYRGKRNEPSYIKYVLEKLSELLKMNKEEIERITTSNARELFK